VTAVPVEPQWRCALAAQNLDEVQEPSCHTVIAVLKLVLKLVANGESAHPTPDYQIYVMRSGEPVITVTAPSVQIWTVQYVGWCHYRLSEG
jgi:hypothetical protein